MAGEKEEKEERRFPYLFYCLRRGKKRGGEGRGGRGGHIPHDRRISRGIKPRKKGEKEKKDPSSATIFFERGKREKKSDKKKGRRTSSVNPQGEKWENFAKRGEGSKSPFPKSRKEEKEKKLTGAAARSSEKK